MYLSNLISGLVFPYLCDKYGRKLTLTFSSLIASISLFISGFSLNFWFWIFLVFVAGCGFGGLETAARVYLSEISAKNFRFNSNVILNIMWAFS